MPLEYLYEGPPLYGLYAVYKDGRVDPVNSLVLQPKGSETIFDALRRVGRDHGVVRWELHTDPFTASQP